MPVYQWVGTNRKNETRKGEMEAANEAIVRSNLTRLKISPSKIKKKPKDLFENVSWLQPKVKEKDVILFARQFSTMIDAGLPIIQCLEILHSQQANKTDAKKDLLDGVVSQQVELQRPATLSLFLSVRSGQISSVLFGCCSLPDRMSCSFRILTVPILFACLKPYCCSAVQFLISCERLSLTSLSALV